MPEGVVELIFDMQETPKSLYWGVKYPAETQFQRAWVSGQRLGPIVIQSGPSTMMGVRFRPGGAWPFFNKALPDLTDYVVPLDLIWGFKAQDVRDRLLAANSLAARFRILESFLSSFIGADTEPDPLVAFALGQISQNPAAATIGEMVERSGYSHRHFTESIKRKVGITPKELAKLNRFQRTLASVEAAREADQIDWRMLAMQSGYYDQSHLIHEFRLFSGFTPTAYLELERPFPNYLVEPI